MVRTPHRNTDNKILGVNHFPDFCGHFKNPWLPFWIFSINRYLVRSGLIKNLFCGSCLQGQKNKECPFLDFCSQFKTPFWIFLAVQYCRRSGVAGNEHVAPLLLSLYFYEENGVGLKKYFKLQ